MAESCMRNPHTIRALRMICIAVVFLFSVIAAGATDYYVNNAGNDALSGTSDVNAWATFNNINSRTLSPGDRIFLKCGSSWNQQLTLHGSGTSNNKIQLTSYGSGSQPKIYRNDIVNDTCVLGDCINYWSISNIRCENAKFGMKIGDPSTTSYGVDVSNCYFKDMNYLASNPNMDYGSGIWFWGYHWDGVSVTWCKFENCALGLACYTGYSNNIYTADCEAWGGKLFGIGTNGWVNSTVERWKIHDLGGPDVWPGAAGIIACKAGDNPGSPTHDVTIRDCQIWNIHQNSGPYDGCGIDFDKGCYNYTLENTTISHCDGPAIELLGESSDNKNLTIRNCQFYDNCLGNQEDFRKYEICSWNPGATGTVSNCAFYKNNIPIGYISPYGSGLTETNNLHSTYIANVAPLPAYWYPCSPVYTEAFASAPYPDTKLKDYDSWWGSDTSYLRVNTDYQALLIQAADTHYECYHYAYYVSGDVWFHFKLMRQPTSSNDPDTGVPFWLVSLRLYPTWELVQFGGSDTSARGYYNDTAITTPISFSRDIWHDMDMRLNFNNHTASFYVDHIYSGSFGFNGASSNCDIMFARTNGAPYSFVFLDDFRLGATDATPPSNPGTPVCRQGSYTNNPSITFDWTASSDGCNSIEGYVFRACTYSGNYNCTDVCDNWVGNTTTTTITGHEGWNYAWLFARDNVSCYTGGCAYSVSGFSNGVYVDTNAPSAPTFTSTPGAHHSSPLVWSWSCSDTGSGIQQYRVEVYDNTAQAYVVNQYQTSTSISVNATSGHSYKCRVFAIDYAANWSVSGWTSDTVCD